MKNNVSNTSIDKVVLDSIQERILNLDMNKSWVISGAPGTGKTLLAVRMAERIFREGKRVLVLMYNRPLKIFIEEKILASDHSLEYEVNTYHKWLYEFYNSYLCINVPKASKYEFNWNKVYHDFCNAGIVYHTILIDEAQDLPEELIRSLKKISDNVVCFIDERQAILNTKTTVKQLEKIGIKRAPVVLEKNYRCSDEINAAAGNIAGLNRVVATNIHGHRPIVIQCKSDRGDMFRPEYDMMTAIIRRNPKASIGILVDYVKLNKVYDALCDSLGNEINVQIYKSQTNRDRIDFHSSGPKVMSYNTAKGIEFDIVILPFFDKVRSDCNEEADRNKMYVAMTRGKKELYILYSEYWNDDPKWAKGMDRVVANRRLFDFYKF